MDRISAGTAGRRRIARDLAWRIAVLGLCLHVAALGLAGPGGPTHLRAAALMGAGLAVGTVWTRTAPLAGRGPDLFNRVTEAGFLGISASLFALILGWSALHVP